QKAFSPKAFANSSKAGFGSLHKLGEGLRVVHCDIRQNFSVKLYVGFFETVHKFAVRHTVCARRRVDSRYPQVAEISFFESAADVSVIETLHHRLSGYTVIFALCSEISFRKLQYLSAFFNRVYTAFDSHNKLPP